ncbi:hypothetical protein TWF696_001832 [Orbilia brochopaga]|uniref:Uncharacterized protein n=1 Tax=Orbilia brochopaga TaxID=3140254 RepID=A0AAV9U672_9PEZI
MDNEIQGERQAVNNLAAAEAFKQGVEVWRHNIQLHARKWFPDRVLQQYGLEPIPSGPRMGDDDDEDYWAESDDYGDAMNYERIWIASVYKFN